MMFADNEILVVAKEGATKEQIIELANEYDAEVVGCIEQTGDYQWRINKGDLSELVENISNEDLISSASFNYFTELCSDSVSYDIHPGNEWSTTIFDGVFSSITKSNLSWNVRAINAPLAWNMMNLVKDIINPINIGLIDNEFDQSHEDLGFAEVFYDNYENNRVDVNEKIHGTHVAGTMAAKGNNDIGICGVYPYADGRLYAASWRGASKYDKNNKYSTMAEKCLLSELILRNVKVINCSYGSTSFAAYYDQKAFQNSQTKSAQLVGDLLNRLLKLNYDFVIVSSAGNDSNDIVVKLAYNKSDGEIKITNDTVAYDSNGMPTVVERESDGNKLYYHVSNSGKSDTEMSYLVTGITDFNKQTFVANDDFPGGHLDSLYINHYTAIPNNDQYQDVYNRIIVVGAVDSSLNICDFSNSGSRTDIYAPGKSIYSTIKGNEYSNKFDGTSMAAPHVAGVAADIWSVNENLTGSEVKKIICEQYNDSSHKNDKGEVDYPLLDASKAVKESFRLLEQNGIDVNNLPQNGAALGWVYESDRETIISGVTVTPYKNGEALTKYVTTTDDYGHFELVLPGGEYTILFSKPGYKEKSFDKVIINNCEVNYFNEGTDEVIALNKELSDTEKLVKVVVDNESVWLGSLDNITTEGNIFNCWFEDVNFDGKPEFVVGPTLVEQGQFQACFYDIYIISGNSLSKINSEYAHRPCSVLVYITNTGEFSKNNMNLSIYKDNSGKYHYINVSPSSYTLETAMSIDEISMSGGNSTSLFSFFNMVGIDDDYSNYSIGNEMVSLDRFIEDVGNELNGSKLCTVKIKTVKLLDSSGKLTDDCYSKKSAKQKLNLLVSSYDSYKLIESDKPCDQLQYLYDLAVAKKNSIKKYSPQGNNYTSDELMYKEILDKYYSSITKKQMSFTVNSSDDTITIDLRGFNLSTIDSLEQCGYSFIDINHDGVNECIISAIDPDLSNKASLVRWVYSVVDGRVSLRLASWGGAGYNYFTLNSDNNSMIYQFKDGIYPGARYYTYYKYNYNNDWDKTEQQIYISIDDNYDQSYYYYDGKNTISISEERFHEIENQWINIERKELTFKPLSRYGETS